VARRKVHYIHIEKDFLAYSIEVDEFDALVDEGYDDIMLVTPKGRFIASLDEWQEFGYIDIDQGSDVRVLQRSYMGRV
jgi:hypothetical protein